MFKNRSKENLIKVLLTGNKEHTGESRLTDDMQWVLCNERKTKVYGCQLQPALENPCMEVRIVSSSRSDVGSEAKHRERGDVEYPREKERRRKPITLLYVTFYVESEHSV